jgi:hypothetical protein
MAKVVGGSLDTATEPRVYFSPDGVDLVRVVPPILDRTFELEAVRGDELWGWSGSDGIAYHWYSDDAARSWVAVTSFTGDSSVQRLPDPPGGVMTSMSFVSETEGFGVPSYDWKPRLHGPYLARTANGGRDWQLVGELPNEATRIEFVDGSIGFAFSEKTLWRTSDGGSSWAEVESPQEPIRAIQIEGLSARSIPTPHHDQCPNRNHPPLFAVDPTDGEWLVCIGESAGLFQPKSVLHRARPRGAWSVVAASESPGSASKPVGVLSMLGHVRGSLAAPSSSTLYLTLTFHDSAALARSSDGGVTWDVGYRSCSISLCGLGGYDDHVWFADGVHLWHAVGDKDPLVVT